MNKPDLKRWIPGLYIWPPHQRRRHDRAAPRSRMMIEFASVKTVKEFRVKAQDGVNISVQKWGNPDDPEIIIIHGFWQSHLRPV